MQEIPQGQKGNVYPERNKIMKKIVFVLLAALLTSSCLMSSRVTSLELPSESMPREEIDIGAYEEKYKEHSGVYLESESIVEHAGHNLGKRTWSFFRVSKLKYIVLNPENEHLGTFAMRTSSSAKLSKYYAKVTYPNGEVKQFRADDLIQEKTSKYEITYKFAYPNLKKGTIIEEGYEFAYRVPSVYPSFEHDIYLESAIPCEKFRFSYAFPDWWTIKAKKIAENVSVDVEWIRDSKNRKTVVVYSAENIPGYKKEAYSPFFKEAYPYYQFQVTKLQMGGYKYESPESWYKAVKNYKKYATKKDGFFSSKVLNTTNEVIKGIDDPIGRLDAIITFIQENIEMTRDINFRDFKKILNDKKGDIYRITGLAQSMLLKAGINAKYLLLHSAKDGYFDNSYITPEQFSRPAIGIKFEDRTYVVFPYIKIPIGYVPDHLQDQPAIAITLGDDSYNYTVDFWDVPVGTDIQNRIKESYKLILDEQGSIHVEEKKTFVGYYAHELRNKLEELKEDEQKEIIEALLTYDDGMVELTSYEIQNLEDYKKPLMVKLEYDIDNLLTVLPDEVIFQTGGLFSPASGAKYKMSTNIRHNPIKVLYDEKFDKDIAIHYPKSWAITTTLKDVNYENTFGSLEGRYDVEEGTLTVCQSRKLKRCYESKKKISDLIKITGIQSDLSIPSIVFQILDE